MPLARAAGYEAAGHVGVAALRLQGAGVTGVDAFWCGLSYYLPGAVAEESSSARERVYVVLDGELTVIAGAQTIRLGRLDSCYIPPKQTRRIVNEGSTVVTMLVIVAEDRSERSSVDGQ